MTITAIRKRPLTDEELELIVRFIEMFNKLSKDEEKPLQQQEPFKKIFSK